LHNGNWSKDAPWRSNSSSLCRKCATVVDYSELFPLACTKSGHRRVDELHSIDFTQDKGAPILLTLKIDGVKE
jgi:hypothetical protein